jgi:hypothetical protein
MISCILPGEVPADNLPLAVFAAKATYFLQVLSLMILAKLLAYRRKCHRYRERLRK